MGNKILFTFISKVAFIFLDEKHMINQEINFRSLRPKIVMFHKWIDKLKKYFVIYFEKGKQNKIKNQNFNSWKLNLKLFRTISLLNFHSEINIDIDTKHENIDYLRDQYIKIIYNIEEFYKRLLNRITLDVDENRNIYGEKYNYKNHVNELDDGIKTEFLEKLFYNIGHLKNQLNSYKIKINYDYEKIEKLQTLLTGYTNSELVNQNETLRKDLKLLIKNTKMWKLMINRIEWAIASKENMLNNTIIESKMNLKKQKVDKSKKHSSHRKI
uniref:BVpp48a protein n=1 Tax=Chelonus inanitus TaxID=49201 RepID=D7FB36_9HYME|nr:BVpp48a protein [Chelonus inanitus]